MSSNKPEEWFNDCILQYLRSPLWTAPVNGFIEEHCHEFKSDEEENRLIYTQLHTQFRTLIENLLTSFIEELGLTIEALVEAVKSPNPDSSSEIELASMILSYIVALDDYPTFRSIMEKRNAEMDLEVMHEFARYTSAALEGDNMDDMSDEEHFLLEMAIRLSLGESDIALKQLEVDDNEMVHEMMVQLAAEHERLLYELLDKEQVAEEQNSLVERANTELLAKREENIAEAMEITHKGDNDSDNNIGSKEGTSVKRITIPTNNRASPKKQVQSLLAPITDRRKEVFGSKGAALPVIPKKATSDSVCSSVVAQQPSFETLKKEVQDSKPTAHSPSKEELEQRAEYFKKQRERLRQAKVHERAEELEEFKKENKFEGSGGVAADAASLKEKEMRVALARRFKEDLIQESRK